MSNEDKIYNQIAYYENQIEQIKKIKQQVAISETEDIRIKIETKHWYGYSEPYLGKEKIKIMADKSTIIEILNEVKTRNRSLINKLIDKLFEERNNAKFE